MNVILSCSGEGNNSASLKNFGSDDRKVDPLHDEKKIENGSLMESDFFLGNNPGDKLMDIRPNRKRSPPTPIETTLHAVDVTSGETMDLNKKADCPPDDDVREQKKIKPESGRHDGHSHQEQSFSNSLSSKVHPFSASFSSCGFDRETVMCGSFSTDKSCLFPVELSLVRDTVDNKVTPSSGGEGPAEIPNLELAFGAKKKMPEEEVLPPPSLNTRDDMAEPLSLSLAFHSSEKEPKAFTFI